MAHRGIVDQIAPNVFTPREYQVEILEDAKERNIIAHLATGSGKTFIAILLIKEMAPDVRRAWSEGGKRTFFVVNTVPLVEQQARAIEQHTDLTVGQFVGSSTLDAWKKHDWEAHLVENQVLVMSSQIFCNMLLHGFLDVTRVNLLVLDECHHTVKDSPMRQIMKLVNEAPAGQRPKVLGLTASIINKKVTPVKLEAQIESLQNSMGCAVSTVHDLDAVNKYSTRPQEVIVECGEVDDPTQLHRRLEAVALRCLQFLTTHRYEPREIYGDMYEELLAGEPDPIKEPKQIICDFLYILNELGPWCADRAASQLLVEVEKLRRKIGYVRHYLLLGVVFSDLIRIRTLCDHVFDKLDLREQIWQYSSPKVLRLLEILQAFAPPAAEPTAPLENGECVPTDSAAGSGTSPASGDSAEPPATAGAAGDSGVVQNGTTTAGAAHSQTAEAPPSGAGTSQAGAPPTAAGETQADRDRQAPPRFSYNPEDPAAVCGLVFVKQRVTARVLYRLIKELRDVTPELAFIYPQYIVGSNKNTYLEPAEVGQAERKKQEDVLCRFRKFECNLLVATSVVEEGVDIPQCNLVVRFDEPAEFRSYVQSKGRARATAAHYLLLVTKDKSETLLRELADYHVIERRLTAHCLEDSEEPAETDRLRELAERRIPPYRPADAAAGAMVTRNSAISLVNRYCNRLPSDTFTRLTPQWKIEELDGGGEGPPMRRCSLRLPVNSPVKDLVFSDWFPSKLLARQSAALKMCQVLYEADELDQHLLPIGKEALLEEGADEQREWVPDGAPRPGTTKRRQYYKKQVAAPLAGPALKPGQRCYLYQFDMQLTCPIPEDQNTRGRRLFRPEQDPRRLGLVTGHRLPEVCAFPIFTRSGEVVVSVRLVSDQLQLSESQLQLLSQFHRFVFCAVLRLEKFPMRFQPEDSSTGFLVVPINNAPSASAGGEGRLAVDWPFLEAVAPRYADKLQPLSNEQRKGFQFDRQTFLDAVIMPWYRNQDQPQFFYVAEICHHLNPGSEFPDDHFRTFTEYYESKYGIRIQNQTQPLLDVDHTSARLNLLTPRFVNRKGVALPAASSETKRAKRESLQQKQILVPELCMVHPFPASLWRKVVTLPSVLYRLNGVMVADGLRRRVAEEIQLGTPQLAPGCTWPQLDFGWSLAEVLERRDRAVSADQSGTTGGGEGEEPDSPQRRRPSGGGDGSEPTSTAKPAAADGRRPRGQQFDIGTWSNDLLQSEPSGPGIDDPELEELGPDLTLPMAITLLTDPAEDNELATVTWGGAGSGNAPVRYGSPTYLGGGGWGGGWGDAGDDASMASESDLSDSSEEEEEEEGEDGAAGGSAARPTGAPPAPQPDPAEEDEEDVFDFEEDSTTLEEVRERTKKKVAEARQRIQQNCLLPAGASLEPLVMARRLAAAAAKTGTVATPSTASAVSAASARAAEERRSSAAATAAATAAAAAASAAAVASASAAISSASASAATASIVSAGPPPAAGCAQSPSSGATTRPDSETRSGAPEPEGGAAGHVIVATPADGGPAAFDLQPDLERHPGPSPALLLQALTMSNANDGINLERLETVGDSFLKFAITVHLYLTYPTIHEGKLSYLRSKQVSNLNLYQLGRAKALGELMVAAKFEPHDNWLPPGYTVPEGLEEEIVESGVTASHLNLADMTDLAQISGEEEVRRLVRDKCQRMKQLTEDAALDAGAMPSFLPYNLLTQHSIPDKSVADCVESLIGAYLVSCGPQGALVFMSWLGIKVLPRLDGVDEAAPRNRLLERQRRRPTEPPLPISSRIIYGQLPAPASPLNTRAPNPQTAAPLLLSGLDQFERLIEYEFRDKFYLLQAFTHASYHQNTLTDCYQRLEFLGDAVLDYLITRHLYEDRRNHSPGALTDLRSALVNNAIFATLAVRYDFHKYFRHYSPGLNQVINKFLLAYGEGGSIAEEYLYNIQEDECETAEDIEVPKALGDVFESVAGAIYLDSGMSLDTVWRVYYRMMQSEIETFSEHVPKSPIRELLELEPETAKFRKPEREINGKVRVTVEVIGKGCFKGLGRNYRIAKCTAAKRALRALKRIKSNRAP
ncbi:endoribonuclease Dcr-1-like [Amphibalanus amphitrite]|uniref:endoribonuclease Dcr-1-like n=1 Tax=Amphibalanus amphitrite TaxID=1232801 RepID=UPI001C925B3A|nr:endoribonuclease Dcr-1-like [Amphibalanus amphitrite]